MGLKDFILNCERYNKELRKNIEYYKNKNQRSQQENEELKKQLSNDHQIKMKRLQQENKKCKEVIDKAVEKIESWYFALDYAERDRLKIIVEILKEVE